MSTRIGIIGANGRMGLAIARLAGEFPEAVVIEGLGRNTNEAKIEAFFENCDVAIDFTTGEQTGFYAKRAAAKGKPFLSGATGLSAEAKADLDAAAKSCALLHATNTSLSLAVVKEIARYAAALLKDYDYDIAILDRHHRMKKDAPSGTAKTIAENIVKGNEGKHEPAFSAIRAGGIVGEHEISFNGFGEVIKIDHSVTNRDVFARGAVQAALWLAKQKPGRYTMDDVLGISATPGEPPVA